MGNVSFQSHPPALLLFHQIVWFCSPATRKMDRSEIAETVTSLHKIRLS